MEFQIILKIILATFLGGVIGFERELARKEAGLRTNMLIALGSCLFAILSQKLAQASGGDPQRLMAQIVSGIGFLGAGAIIHSRFAVHGLTTAATIWAVSAIGISVAAGYYLISIIITIFILIILSAQRLIISRLEQELQLFCFIIKLPSLNENVLNIKQIMREEGITAHSFEIQHKKDFFEIFISFRTSEQKSSNFLNKLISLQGIEEILQEKL